MNLFHNPVLVKELRGRMRGGRAFLILTAFLTVLAIITVLLYLVSRDSVSDPFSSGSYIGKILFIGVCTVALIQVMIIVPAQAAGALAGEKERETYDLLITTLLPPWKIVLGKLLASLAYAVLLIVAAVPLMGLAFFFGGVTGTEVVLALLGLLMTAVLYGSVGIFWSSVAKRTITATVLTQATNITVLLGFPFLMLIFVLFFEGSSRQPNWINSYPFIYTFGSILALHPFLTLGWADALLSDGENRLWFPLDEFGPEKVWIPAPWLAFVIAATLMSLLLILLAARRVRLSRQAARVTPPRPAPPVTQA